VERYLARIPRSELPEFAISEHEFEDIKAAINGVTAALNIEEKYNIMKENYVELETALLNIALTWSLFDGANWSSTMTDLYTINRRLANLLTTARLYLDQVAHDLSTLYGNPSLLLDEFKNMTSAEYDNSLGYRVMEALRNYIQHQGLPLVAISYQTWSDPEPVSSTDIDLPSQAHYVVKPQLSTEQLRKSGRVKSPVLKELERLGEHVDVRPFTRQYIQALTDVHVMLRAKMAPDTEVWSALIEQCLRRLAVPGSWPTTTAVYTGYNNDVDVFISREQVQRREWLIQRNTSLLRLPENVVSNQVRQEKWVP
jgi:hypothetical protein